MAAPECLYCGATDGLRVKCDGGGYIAPEYICADCFTGTDTGPCFDDLPEVKRSPAFAYKLTASASPASDAACWRLRMAEMEARLFGVGYYSASDAKASADAVAALAKAEGK